MSLLDFEDCEEQWREERRFENDAENDEVQHALPLPGTSSSLRSSPPCSLPLSSNVVDFDESRLFTNENIESETDSDSGVDTDTDMDGFPHTQCILSSSSSRIEETSGSRCHVGESFDLHCPTPYDTSLSTAATYSTTNMYSATEIGTETGTGCLNMNLNLDATWCGGEMGWSGLHSGRGARGEDDQVLLDSASSCTITARDRDRERESDGSSTLDAVESESAAVTSADVLDHAAVRLVWGEDSMRPAAVHVEEEWITGCDRIWGDEDGDGEGEMGERKHVMIEEDEGEEEGEYDENSDDGSDSTFSSHSSSRSTSTSSSEVSHSSTLCMVRTLRSAGVDRCLSPSDSARSIDFSLFFDPCPPLSLGSHLETGPGSDLEPGSRLGQRLGLGSVIGMPGVAAIRKHRKDRDKDRDMSKAKGKAKGEKKGKERERESRGGNREKRNVVSPWEVEKEAEKAEWSASPPSKSNSILRSDRGSDSMSQIAMTNASESHQRFVPLLEIQSESAQLKNEKEHAADRYIRSHVTCVGRVAEIPDVGPGSVIPSDSESESDGDLESVPESLDTAQSTSDLNKAFLRSTRGSISSLGEKGGRATPLRDSFSVGESVGDLDKAFCQSSSRSRQSSVDNFNFNLGVFSCDSASASSHSMRSAVPTPLPLRHNSSPSPSPSPISFSVPSLSSVPSSSSLQSQSQSMQEVGAMYSRHETRLFDQNTERVCNGQRDKETLTDIVVSEKTESKRERETGTVFIDDQGAMVERDGTGQPTPSPYTSSCSPSFSRSLSSVSLTIPPLEGPESSDSPTLPQPLMSSLLHLSSSLPHSLLLPAKSTAVFADEMMTAQMKSMVDENIERKNEQAEEGEVVHRLVIPGIQEIPGGSEGKENVQWTNASSVSTKVRVSRYPRSFAVDEDVGKSEIERATTSSSTRHSSSATVRERERKAGVGGGMGASVKGVSAPDRNRTDALHRTVPSASLSLSGKLHGVRGTEVEEERAKPCRNGMSWLQGRSESELQEKKRSEKGSGSGQSERVIVEGNVTAMVPLISAPSSSSSSSSSFFSSSLPIKPHPHRHPRGHPHARSSSRLSRIYQQRHGRETDHSSSPTNHPILVIPSSPRYISMDSSTLDKEMHALDPSSTSFLISTSTSTSTSPSTSSSKVSHFNAEILDPLFPTFSLPSRRSLTLTHTQTLAHPQNDDIMYSLSTVLSDVDISCVQPCASIFDSIIHNENSEDNALSESVVEFMTAESEATG